MTTILSLGLLSFGIVLSGCASSSANDGALGSSVTQATTIEAEPSAVAGTWTFALASSDVAAPLEERCKKESGNDAAKSKACWDEIATQARMEKIRFAKNAAGHTMWTSFETDGTKENVFVEVPVELAKDGPGHLVARITGAPKGEHAARFSKASVNAMRIEVVDARTIAMVDPKKGRLVYTKE